MREYRIRLRRSGGLACGKVKPNPLPAVWALIGVFASGRSKSGVPNVNVVTSGASIAEMRGPVVKERVRHNII
jgi:hypothetical protein